MGGTLSSVFNRLFGRRQLKILMIGLDAAGKTTVLYQLKLKTVMTTIPTIGFNVETVQHQNISFTIWDIGGGDKIRPLWHHYFVDGHGIILVVDSHDRERIDEVAELIHYMIEQGKYNNAVMLVLANKQDLAELISKTEMIEKLRLNSLNIKSWHIQPACALQGTGLYEGLDWLCKEIEKNDYASV